MENKLESLLLSKKLKSEDRWYPVLLDNYKEVIDKGALSNMDDKIRRNIGYSLQYLEFLDVQIKELVLSGVIKTMIYKNYVITSVSIIESLLEEIIRFNKLQSKDYFEVQGGSIDSNEFKDLDGKLKKIRTQILVKLDKPKEIQMKFDDIIKKIQSKNKKNKILNVNHDVILALKRFRQLRNKVHLSNVEEGKTNWHEFSNKEYVTVKFLLRSILTAENLQNSDLHQYIEFLELTKDEEEIIKNFNKENTHV